MCTVPLPAGDNPIAVNKSININISNTKQCDLKNQDSDYLHAPTDNVLARTY